MKDSQPFSLSDYLDAPERLFNRDRIELDHLAPADIDAFRLEAARRKLTHQANRIPAVARLLDGKNLDHFQAINDFVPVLLAADAYKSYDQAWLDCNDFKSMTAWIAGFTAKDYSTVDMNGCASLTEWCSRIEAQTGDLVCHSAGTSGTLSFVPRSQQDVDLFAHALMWNTQAPLQEGRRLFIAGQPNDVHLFSPTPRRQYRITAGIYSGVERCYLTPPVQTFDIFQSPEFAITQGLLRTARARGTIDKILTNPIVQKHKNEVEAHEATQSDRLAAWTNNLTQNFRGKRIIFQGSFDMAWNLAQRFRAAGVSNAFAANSIFSVIGGVKDGTTLPDDWKEQFREAIGVPEHSFLLGWGMSEVNGGIRQCPAKNFHFPPHLIPFLLKPGTREPLPRRGVQHGQFAMLELVSQDNWGGMISGDCGTMDWESHCPCGRPGPLLNPTSIQRLATKA